MIPHFTRKNLISTSAWQNNTNAPFATHITSIEGESVFKNPSAASGTGIDLTGLCKNGKMYLSYREFMNNSDATTYATLCTASTNTTTDGQIFVNYNNVPNGQLITQGLTLCHRPETYKYYRGRCDAGGSFMVKSPRLYEDMNWTNNIFNTVYAKLRNHFRADCAQVVYSATRKVPNIFNTLNTQATQATATKQPMLVPVHLGNGENRSYIQFDGVDDTLSFTESVPTEFDIWLVASNLPTASNTNFLFSKGNGDTDLSNIGIAFNVGIRAFYYDTSTNIRIIDSSVYPLTGINVIRYRFNTIDGSKLYLNGKLIGSVSSIVAPRNTSTFCTFASRYSIGSYLNANLYEYLSFSSVLSDSEASNVYRYLRQRYDSPNF